MEGSFEGHVEQLGVQLVMQLVMQQGLAIQWVRVYLLGFDPESSMLGDLYWRLALSLLHGPSVHYCLEAF